MVYIKKYIVSLSVISSFLAAMALSSCSDKDGVNDIVTPPAPELIEFSVGTAALNSNTRAVITNDDTHTKSFSESTSLYMLMKSQNKDNEAETKVTRTIMFAEAQTETSVKFSKVNYSDSEEFSKFARYWDDSYGRSSLLSVLAVCTPGMGPKSSTKDTKAWVIGNSNSFVNQGWTAPLETESYPSVAWPIGNSNQVDAKDQSSTNFIKNQDLCFSNNIGKYEESDNRMKFDATTKTFEAKKLIFYHALSKLTFKFKNGNSFSDQEFKFASGTNVKLSNFYNEGTFNMEDGVFVENTLKNNSPIKKIYENTVTSGEASDGIKMVLDALVIPGTPMTTDDTAITFTIVNNEYSLSRKQLYALFSDAQKSNYFDDSKLKAGVNYVFTFSIDKSQIKNITASIVEWETVDVNDTPSNARIKLNVEERGTPLSSEVDFYRKADNKTTDGIYDEWTAYNWVSGYEKYTKTLSFDNDHFKTEWYWDSNKHYYHFRALSPAGTSIDETNKEYAPLSSSNSGYDICWGAPFKDVTPGDDKPNPNELKWNYGNQTNGFDGVDEIDFSDDSNKDKHQIYKAIGPTNDQIKLILFHAMSDVTFNITTSTDENKKVNLGDGNTSKTVVKLENFYPSGKILLGNGLVQTTGNKSAASDIAQNNFTPAVAASETTSAKAAVASYLYGVVPQSLEGVQLRITTPDNNEYVVALNNIAATTITNKNIVNPYTDNDNKIDRWYPNFKYTYTFTLEKNKLPAITVTILDWEEVTVNYDEPITIK